MRARKTPSVEAYKDNCKFVPTRLVSAIEKNNIDAIVLDG